MSLFHLHIMSNVPIQIPISVDILKNPKSYQDLFPIDFDLRITWVYSHCSTFLSSRTWICVLDLFTIFHFSLIKIYMHTLKKYAKLKWSLTFSSSTKLHTYETNIPLLWQTSHPKFYTECMHLPYAAFWFSSKSC